MTSICADQNVRCYDVELCKSFIIDSVYIFFKWIHVSVGHRYRAHYRLKDSALHVQFTCPHGIQLVMVK